MASSVCFFTVVSECGIKLFNSAQQISFNRHVYVDSVVNNNNGDILHQQPPLSLLIIHCIFIYSMIQFFDGGPIIAFQIENEYGSYYSDDVKYMEHLKSVGKFSVLKHVQTTVLHNFITTKTFQRN